MCLTLILGVREAQAVVLLLDEDFDFEITGAPPAFWEDTYYSWAGVPHYTAEQAAALGVSIRVDDQVHYGPSGKSLHFLDNNVGWGSGVGSQVIGSFSPAQSVTLEYYIRSAKTGTGSDSWYESAFALLLGDASGAGSWYSLGFGSANGGGRGGYIGVIDGLRGVWADRQLLEYEKDTWYYVRNTIDVPTKTIAFYVEQADAPWINGGFAVQDSQYANTHVDGVNLHTANSQGADAYIDSIRVYGPPQSAKYDLPVVGEDKALGGWNRAEQGIASGGSGAAGEQWFTSTGTDAVPVLSPRKLSSFDSMWNPVNVDVDAGDITVEGQKYIVLHIGDIGYVPSGSGSYIYAPITARREWEPSGDRVEMIALYSTSDLKSVNAWRVLDNTGFGGLTYHESERYGDKLYAVEYVTDPDSDSTSIFVYDEAKLRVDSTFLGTKLTITTKFANGIALIEGSDDFLYVSAGPQLSGEAWIEVFDLEELWNSPGPHRPYKNRKYTYHIPWLPGHGEGLTFKDGELWVAKGSYVANLKTEGILPKRKGKSVGTSGSWGAQASWDKMVPDASTVATVSASVLQVDGSAEALDAIIDNGGAVVLQSPGTMTLGDMLDIRNGSCLVQGGSLSSARMIVGREGNGSLEISEPSAQVVVSEALVFGANGSLSSVPGSIVHMTGSDLQNESTKPAQYADMINLKLLFEGGPAAVDSFEIGGVDVGPSTDGQTVNFALGTLALGGPAGMGQVLLVDLFDNQPAWQGTEAQYVQNLIVNPGSTLYLNWKNLYINGVLVNAGDGALYGGGTILAIPEPSTFVLLSMAALGLLAVAWRKRTARRISLTG